MQHVVSAKKVAIVGPESTGKTTLARSLAERFNTCWVEEYARTYLNDLGRPYEEADLIKIARGQVAAEERLIKQAHRVLICDTTLMVIKVWSEIKYGRCHPDIIDMMNAQSYDLHLLTCADIPWQYDPQREHPHSRAAIKKVYRYEMGQQKIRYFSIQGSHEQRMRQATQAILALT